MFAQKANAFSSHIYNIDMYTSPSEWTISKYSIPFEIIPIDSLPLQRTSEKHIFTSTHMNTFTFQKLPQMPVGLFSWTEYSHLIICIYYYFPQKSSVNLSPRQNLLWINNYQLKRPLEGCSAPHREPCQARSLLRPVLGSQATESQSGMGLDGGSASSAILGKFKFL